MFLKNACVIERSKFIYLQLYRLSSSQSISLWIILGFQDTILFLDVSLFQFNSFLSLICFFFLVFVLHCFRRSPRSGHFYLLGNPLNINQSINHLDLVVSNESSSWRARVPAYACRRVAFPRSRAYALVLRHGNRHAKPAGLRVPVRSNLRKFLVKCSTSGGFFVNFYTLFFSTTSSILLRKV